MAGIPSYGTPVVRRTVAPWVPWPGRRFTPIFPAVRSARLPCEFRGPDGGLRQISAVRSAFTPGRPAAYAAFLAPTHSFICTCYNTLHISTGQSLYGLLPVQSKDFIFSGFLGSDMLRGLPASKHLGLQANPCTGFSQYKARSSYLGVYPPANIWDYPIFCINCGILCCADISILFSHCSFCLLILDLSKHVFAT